MNLNATQAQLESDWAIKLQKNLQAKNTIDHTTVSPITEQIQLQEELKYFKLRIIEAIKKHDKEKMIKYFEIICNIRARVAINKLKQAKEQLGQFTEASVKYETKAFVDECYKLCLIINRIIQS